MEITLRKRDIRPDLLQFFRPVYRLGPKNDAGIPWRVALALQADGWILRSDIIWAKSNPMPESVTDRPTKSHEYIFLLSKNERYFYDNEAVKENAIKGAGGSRNDNKRDRSRGNSNGMGASTLATISQEAGRNLRSVWTVNLRPYKGAHFATYPPELITPCIKAGTSAKGRCPTCGAPWRRVVERAKPPHVADSDRDRYGNGKAGVHRKVGSKYQQWLDQNPAETVGWEPSCACPDHDPVPCILFDPFVGSGTSIQESQRLGRVCVGMELSEKSLKLARDRIERPHKPQSARDPGEFLPLFDRVDG